MARNRYYNSAHWKRLKLACHHRDGWRCTVNGCTSSDRLVCDHIETRPNSDRPTAADVLANVRTLCGFHDYQAKEKSGEATRRRAPRLAGCDAAGMPLDPAHPWRV